MKIHFTKKEYQSLLDMIAVADWVVHAHAEKKEEFNKEYEALREKIYSCAKEMGCENRIEYSNESNCHQESRKYEESLHSQLIEPYEDGILWDGLSYLLAERDVVNTVGAEKFNKIEPARRISLVEEAQEKYTNEFENQGIGRLVIDESIKVQQQHTQHHHHGHGCCDHDHH
jgi:hypothetical protein